ncbi:MAG TPA: hypothetical protein VF432_10195 [Thermoanaerobaculia bacterium]
MIVDTTSVRISTFSLGSGDELNPIILEMPGDGDAEIWVSNGDPSDVEIDMEKLAIQQSQEVRHPLRYHALAAPACSPRS